MICFILMGNYGLGRHRQTVDMATFLQFRRYSWVYSLTAPIIAYSILKISIALSLIRLSRSKWYSWTLWGVIGM